MATIYRPKDPHQNPYLREPKRPIYAVCRLMRRLPDDIKNAGALTRDQSQMAEAVAFYADVTYKTIIDGLAEIGDLIAIAPPGRTIAHLGLLMRHLCNEAQFMIETLSEYEAAAAEPWRET